MDNIPIDKSALQKLIGKSCANKGIPQGGCISGIICNMVLDGLESEIMTYNSDLHYIRYADDFVVIGKDRDVLNKSLEIIKTFLSERGLHLSKEKTHTTHINEGFDFLGWHIKSNSNLLTVTPSLKNVSSLLYKVECIMKSYGKDNQYHTYNSLLAVICGWVNYHIDVVDICSLYEVKNKIFDILHKYEAENQLIAFVNALF